MPDVARHLFWALQFYWNTITGIVLYAVCICHNGRVEQWDRDRTACKAENIYLALYRKVCQPLIFVKFASLFLLMPFCLELYYLILILPHLLSLCLALT